MGIFCIQHCVFITLFVASSYTFVDTASTALDDTNENRASSRIAAGVDAKAGENLDFAMLSVFFQNQAQICGGSLIFPQYVITTATCVQE